MKNYEYVPKKEWQKTRKDLINLIQLVQKEVKKQFSFSYKFIGSSSRNMITREVGGNRGYDFDVNIVPNDPNGRYSPERLKNILMRAFDKHSKQFEYDNSEDSRRVITIKVKDTKNSKILHSCDFAIVHDYVDEEGNDCQEFVYFNKKQNTYEWQAQPAGYYKQQEKVEWIKENNWWEEVKERYIDKKCQYSDKKKSRQLFAEAVNEVANKYGYFEEEIYETGYCSNVAQIFDKEMKAKEKVMEDWQRNLRIK